MATTRQVTGTVILLSSSAPQSGLQVRLYKGLGSGRALVASGETNTKGRFLLNIAGANFGGTFSLEVWSGLTQLGATGDTRWPASRDLKDIVVSVEFPETATPSEPDPDGQTNAESAIVGVVWHEDGTPLVGITVSVYEVGFPSLTPSEDEEEIFEIANVAVTAITGEGGMYGLSLVGSGAGAETPLSLVVRAGASGELGSSKIVYRYTGERLRLDITVSDDSLRSPSEYSRLTANMRDVIVASGTEDPDAALESTLSGAFSARQAAWTSGRTDWALDKVGHRALATKIAAEMSGWNNIATVSPEVIYALLRSGLPGTAKGILAQPPSRLEAALGRAQRQNLIAHDVSIEDALLSLQGAIGQLLDDGGEDALGSILRTSQELEQAGALNNDQITEFCVEHARYTGPEADWWDRVAEFSLYEAGEVAEAKRLVTLGTLGLGHAPCVRAILTTLGTEEAAEVATWNADTWATVADAVDPLPYGLDGQTVEEQKASLAQLLEEQAALAFPRRNLHHQLTGTGSIGEGLGISGPLGNLLEDTDFDFLKHPLTAGRLVDAEVTSAGDIALLRQAQRLVRIAPSTRRAGALERLMSADLNLQSAAQIVRLGRSRFAERFADGDDTMLDEAMGIFRRAQSQAAMAGAFFLQAHPALGRAPLRFIPDDDTAISDDDVPGWSSLTANAVGSRSAWCESIHGPSAYLVDLLHWLDQRKRPFGVLGPDSALEALTLRRPDLTQIPLTCENTERVLPVIDLTMEVLEAAVTNDASVRSSVVGSNEMLPTPQFTNPVAYDVDHLGGAIQSFLCPVHQPLIEARAFLAHLGIDRTDLMRVFQRIEMVEEVETPVPSNAQIAFEELGLSVESAAAITAEPNGTEEDFWPMEDLGDPVTVAMFRRATGISWPELLDLLHTRVANPFGAVEEGRLSVSMTGSSPYDFDSYRLLQLVSGGGTTNPDSAAYTRLRKVLRLWRATGWSLPDLDRVLVAIGAADTTDWNDVTLTAVADVHRLERMTGLTVVELAGCFGSTLDTWRDRETADLVRPSLIERSFHHGSVFSQAEQAEMEEEASSPYPAFPFLLNENRTELLSDGDRKPSWDPTLTQYTTSMQAVLGVDEGELGTFIERLQDDHGALTGSGTVVGILCLANLARLHRWSALARVLDLRPTEMLRFAELLGQAPIGADGVVTNEGPFASPTSLVAFIEEVRELQAMGWSIDELDWLVRNAATDRVGPTDAFLQGVLGRLRGTAALQSDALSTADRIDALARQLATEFQVERTLIDALDNYMWLGTTPTSSEGVARFTAWPVSCAFVASPVTTAATANITLTEDATWSGGTIVSGTEVTVAGTTALVNLGLRTTLAAGSEVSISGAVATFATSATNAGGAVTISSGTTVSWTSAGTPHSEALTADADGTLASGSAINAASVAPLGGGGNEYADLIDYTGLLTRFLRADFLEVPAIDEGIPWADILRDAPTFADDFTVLDGVAKAALLRQKVRADDAEQAAWVARSEAWSLLAPAFLVGGSMTLRNLSVPSAYTRVKATLDLFDSRSRLPGAAPTFAELLLAPTADNLVARTGWDASALGTLVAALGGGDISSGADLTLVLDRMDLCRRAGANPAIVQGWGEIGGLSAFTPAIARSVVKAARSRYETPEAWSAVARPIRDRVRKQMRDALVSYLIATSGEDFQEADDLYQHYLIDVSTNPEVLTSRILQATCAAQLFVHRALFGLEGEQIGRMFNDEDREEWEWMRNYRVWEAARKVFLYPENWIEPELRDDKTPFFKSLEQELGQGDINAERVEQATLDYLDRLADVSSLQILACYSEQESDSDGIIDRLHVFARTRSEPATYWYRRREDSATWTPWERVEAEVQGDQLLPIVYNRRLLLFWADIEETQAEDETSPSSWSEVHLSVSEYRDGKWTGHRTSAEPFPCDDDGRVKLTRGESAICLVSELSESNELRIRLLVCTQTLYKKLTEWWEISAMTLNPCTMEMVPENPEFTDVDRLTTGSSMWVAPGFLSTEKDEHTTLHRLAIYQGEVDSNGETTGEAQLVEILGFLPEALIVVPNQWNDFVSQSPFFVNVANRVYFVEPMSADEDTLAETQRSAGLAVSRIGSFRRGTSALPGAIGASEEEEEEISAAAIYLSTDQYPSREASKRDIGKVIGVLAGDDLTGTLAGNAIRYRFQSFYHPYACRFIKEVRRHGPFGLLAPNPHGEAGDLFRQALQGAAVEFDVTFAPTSVVHEDRPVEEIDFAEGGAYSQYNWELFFHLPLYLATQLAEAGRYDEAFTWFHTMFDPRTRTAVDTEGIEGAVASAIWWKVKPFLLPASAPITSWLAFTGGDGDNEAQDAFERQVAAWREEPFNPHLLARMRPGTYPRALVMRYLDTLLDWGDHLFGKDTIESINEATQLYIFARQILGDRPALLEPLVKPTSKTFDDLKDSLDDFGNALVAIENAGFSARGRGRSMVRPKMTMLHGVGHTSYFGIPFNARLLSYWDTVDDRLFKIRNGLNIEGVVRSLPFFQPPIDPALLVRASAFGLDIGSILDGLTASLPGHRFVVMQARATGVAASVRALGGAILSALEKKDGETMARLRQDQEIALLDVVGEVRARQLEEAETSLDALQASKDTVQQRKRYYERLISNGWNQKEISAMQLSNVAAGAEVAAGFMRISQAIGGARADWEFGRSGDGFHYVRRTGGEKKGRTRGAYADKLQVVASAARGAAAYLSTVASYKRREHEWKQQARQAEQEITGLNKQIEAARLRVKIAEQEVSNHALQKDHAEQVLEFMKLKFTNEELYQWMASQLATLHFQQYQLAVTLAKKAEACYNFELARSDSFIQPIYWDGARKGLLAGERLAADLERMDARYLENDIRELELTKRISLQRLDPLALVHLREDGECYFELPEVLFDLDCPGHYLRRISGVAVTVSCVASGQGQVNVRLTLEGSKLRSSPPTASPPVPPAEDYGDMPFIVTSTALEDPGIFSADPNSPRYLPFERRGAVSSWHLAFCNRDYPQLDWDSISDVTLHLRYTARDGGETAMSDANDAIPSRLNALMGGFTSSLDAGDKTSDKLVVGISAKRDDPDAWFAAQEAGANAVELVLGADRLPYFAVGRLGSPGWKVTAVHVIAAGVPTSPTAMAGSVAGGGSSDTSMEFAKWPSADPESGDIVRLASTSSWSELATWPESITVADLTTTPDEEGEPDPIDLDLSTIDDILVVLEITAT